MKKKPGSIHFNTILLITSLIAVLMIGGAMTLILMNSIRTFQDQTHRSSATLLNFYREELSAGTDDLRNATENIYNSNPGFALFARGKYTNNEKLLADNNLRSQINAIVPYDGLVAAFDRAGSVSIWQVGSGFSRYDFMNSYQLEKQIQRHIVSLPRTSLFTWTLYRSADSVFLIYPWRKGDFYLAACIDLSKFIISHGNFEDSQNYAIAFFNGETILTNNEFLSSCGITLNDITGNHAGFINDLKYILQTSPVSGLPVSIASVMTVSQYLSHYRSLIVLIVVLFMLLAVFIIGLFAWFRRILAYPLNKIVDATELVADPHNFQAPAQGQRETRISELQHINEALFRLVNQKVMAARENERRKTEQEHAQLQYFQLQTRSHFFINCLKSLYNMLEMQEYDKMRRMIIRFSDHIRFIFHDNLILVRLSEELAEVNDYADIVRMDASTPIMVVQKVPESLKPYLVPPLIIQTFLENAVKHTSRKGSYLVFVIDCEMEESNDRQYLRLKLSDNGSGYDPEMLKMLNYDSASQYEQYHVGISNLKRRMQILYHDDCSIAFFNDPVTGGAVVRLYLPAIISSREKES